MIKLTPKQLKILTIIRDYQLTRGYSPTMQELAEETGVSKVTVFEHVEALIKKGALHRDPNKARSLELTDEAVLPDEQRASRIPLVGTIAAGAPIDAVETREFLDLEEVFSSARGRTNDRYVLRVRGDSMIDEQIREGDFVICEKRENARNGETVVALLDNGEATLKKFYKERKGGYRLQPANDRYEPIYTDSVRIQGVVVGVVRQY